MVFTSWQYLAFLALVFLVHWNLPERARKAFLVVASYAFYCSWRWEFGFLLLGLSVFNWFLGAKVLPRASSSRPLLAGILVNLLPLVVFKYTAFLATNADSVLALAGAPWRIPVPDLLLPLGISFFAFQGVAYLVDVASGDEPFSSLLDFLLYKAFWAQLVAGPIIRPGEIESQIRSHRTLDDRALLEGSRRILLGFAKKIVLADTLAPFADAVFGATTPSALDCVTGTLAFGFQIYCDFSAYSDIAIGSARLFGFVFPENFDWPYESHSPQEFWNRWHMTLSRWIRDYVHTPLAFAARHRPRLSLLWLFLAMVVCGFWHGAQWTFALWGAWHGLLLVANQTFLKRFFARPGVLGQAATFSLVSAGWIFFRARSLAQVGDFLASVFTLRGGPSVLKPPAVLFVLAALAALLLGRRVLSSLAPTRARLLRPALDAALVFAVIAFGNEAKTFIYFQF